MPLITKRPIRVNSAPDLNPAPAGNVPQLTVETPAPQSPASTKTEVAPPQDDYCCSEFDVPLFYNPFAPLLQLLGLIILIVLVGAVLIIVLNAVFFGFMGLILFILPKKQKCSVCGKIYSFKDANNNRCPYCNALQEDEIKPH